MISLIVRLGVLLAVVFGVAYAVTRAFRQSAHGRAARRIQADVTALKQGLEAGLYSDAEYRNLSSKIRIACEREGIEVPELPEFIHPNEREES